MVVSAILFTGCSDDNGAAGNLGSLVLSNTYATIPEAGGSTTITIKATGDWKIENVIKNENGDFKLVDEKGNESDAWFTLSQLSGSAGDTELTITANGVDGGRETEIRIGIGEYTKQFFMIRQGSLEAQSATCADVIAGADGKTYRVKGVCTSIANTTYGNWYLDDGTGVVYIYGTLDADGKTQNFSSLNIEIGDSVELEGPKTTYGTTVELVNVTVIKIVKSLAKIASPEVTLPKDGGELEVKVAYKGNGAYFSIPEEYKGWIANSSSEYIAGIPTKIEQNPADTMVFKFNVAPNDLGARTGSITFISSKGESSSTLTYSFTQEGGIREVTIADFNSAPDGAAQYKITGVITSIVSDKYGNIYIKDATGEAYVYGTLTADGQSQQFATLGLKVGDIVTLVGPKTSYNGNAQMKDGVYQEHISVTPKTVAEFRALDDSKTDYYMLTGKVSKVAEAELGAKDDIAAYGNFDIVDETGAVYVYGVLPGWGGAKGQFGTLGINYDDTITIITKKTTYKGLVEADGAFYFSHASATE